MVSGGSGGSARPLNYMTPAMTPPLGFPPPFESYVPGSSRAMWRKGQLVSGPSYMSHTLLTLDDPRSVLPGRQDSVRLDLQE